MPRDIWRQFASVFSFPRETQGHGIAFVPTLCLVAYFAAGEIALVLLAVLLPLALFMLQPMRLGFRRTNDGEGDLSEIEARLDAILGECASGTRNAICFAVGIDDAETLQTRHGARAFAKIGAQLFDRLEGAMRTGDATTRFHAHRFAACVGAGTAVDLETGLQIAARIQERLDEPVAIEGLTIYPSVSVGFCLASRVTGADGQGWLRAAVSALDDASAVGPGGVRAYSAALLDRDSVHAQLRKDALDALGLGQIRAWFQPQISTETGQIIGVEALARWEHPVRGTLGPDVFLPVLESAGLMDRLGDTIVDDSLRALSIWRDKGVTVPEVSVNFSAQQLRSPNLKDRIAWALERYDLPPECLRIEILETVFAEHDDDMICRSIQGLAKLGCAIDLDDYGVGHASIAAIRRFGVSRIKIDRSFVMRIDTDSEQRKMLTAILSLAEQLGLDTLGEGVETAGEHTLLSQLGCSAVQGFGIARPMPLSDLPDWAKQHSAKLPENVQVGPTPKS
jgi:EAL domain-containing protein (putative c-di-GMP-specific phosphodiesterase class I)/GGDEF domain-containing protein